MKEIIEKFICVVSYQSGEFIFNSNNFLFTTTTIGIVFQQMKTHIKQFEKLKNQSRCGRLSRPIFLVHNRVSNNP
jgi:mannose-1-phosphate guanylyltransferase